MSFQRAIENDETWASDVLETPDTLHVVECYKEWCGPCKAIVSSFRRISLDLGDAPLKFYTANVDKVDALEEYRQSCKPQFLFYKDGQLLQRVSGVNYPELSKCILSMMTAV